MSILRLVCTALGVALPLAATGCSAAGSDAAAPVHVASLALRPGATPAPPPTGTPLEAAALRELGGWDPVKVPDIWGLRRRARGLSGWYHGVLALPPERGEWSLLLDGAWEEVQVFDGGLRLGGVSSEAPSPPLVYPASHPVTVPLPAGPGPLDLLIYYRASPAEIGLLLDVLAGPSHEIAAIAHRQDLLRRTLPNALGLIGLVGGVMALLLARFTEERGVRWFGFATSLWCLASLIPAAPTSPVGWLGSVVLHGFVPAIAVALHRVTELRRPGVEAALLASVALGAVLRAIAVPLLIPAVDLLWWIANLFVGLYLLPLAVRSLRVPTATGARWVLFAAVVLLIAGAHDVASLVAGHMLFAPFSLFAAATPVIAIATAGAIVTTLASAVQRVQGLNTELELRVEEKRRALAASWARTAELERERAIAAERERMMRDMHDGTGGQLVSALSLVEAGEFRNEDLAETLRAALADLRLSIDSLESGPPDLLALLALARTRLEGRLEHHGLRFAWEVEDVPAPPGFGPEQSLHVLRIFQEAVTNAIKHARARTIAVRTGVVRDAAGRAGAFVEIADDGTGAAAAGPLRTGSGGRGLRNMRRRAEEIGAECTITSSAAGTTVRLLLPLDPDAPHGATRLPS